MHTIMINKGFELNLIKNKKFKTFVICLVIKRKLDKNKVTLNSLLSNVLGQASNEYDEMVKISRYLEEIYGGIFSSNIVKKGDYQILQFYGEVVLTDYTKEINSLPEKITKFIYEIINNPLVENESFNKTIVDNEKENLKQSISNKLNNKSSYALEKCLEKMCHDEIFGISADGYLEKIDEITPKILYSHYKNILSSSKMNLLVIGDIDFNLTNLTKKNFSNTKMHNKICSKPLFYNIKQEEKSAKFIHEEVESSQGQILMAFRSNINPVSKDFFDYMIFNEILGSSSNSLLFKNIREKESLCYTAYSFIYRFSGILIVQAGIDLNNKDKFIDLVNTQITDIKNRNITQKDFNEAKQNFCKKIKLIEDSPQSIINFYGTQILLNDKTNIKEFYEKSEDVKFNNIIDIPNKIWLDTIYTLGSVD